MSGQEQRVHKLEASMLPKPEPDMTGWTWMEKTLWYVEQNSLQTLIRESAMSVPVPTEELDARDAEDAAILAARAALDAAEMLARNPSSPRAKVAALDAREAAEEAQAAAEAARRRADEAALRPPVENPAVVADEPIGEPATPEPAPEPTLVPKPKRSRRSPPQVEPAPRKEWWEERARWRERGTADYDWDDGVRYECIHEYDPLTYDDK